MTYLAVALVYLLVCAGLGLARGQRAPSQVMAASLAAAMVCAQFALLMTK
jgi:hypothetical protein